MSLTLIEFGDDFPGFDMSCSEIFDKDQSQNESYFLPKVSYEDSLAYFNALYLVTGQYMLRNRNT